MIVKVQSSKFKGFEGFSIMETITAISIMALIGVISLNSFLNLNKSEALAKEKISLVSILSEARSLTLASKDSSEYGVHLDTAGATIFKGIVYSSGDSSNVFYPFNRLVQMTSAVLSGGGADIIFERLTGQTTNDGAINLALISDSMASTTVSVQKTGVAE